MFWPMVLTGGIFGYFGPNVFLSRRIAGRQVEHRAGFPDFMDLLVVCADAGLSMEAALDRVGRELADSYRSLSANVHMATLELRAGRTLSETLDHLADRLGLEEARSFATLLQQSAFHAGSLQTSVPTMLVLEPVVAVLLGAIVLGEHMSISGLEPVALAPRPGLAVDLIADVPGEVARGIDADRPGSEQTLHHQQDYRCPRTKGSVVSP